jgi:hypothetical protein
MLLLREVQVAKNNANKALTPPALKLHIAIHNFSTMIEMTVSHFLMELHVMTPPHAFRETFI